MTSDPVHTESASSSADDPSETTRSSAVDREAAARAADMIATAFAKRRTHGAVFMDGSHNPMPSEIREARELAAAVLAALPGPPDDAPTEDDVASEAYARGLWDGYERGWDEADSASSAAQSPAPGQDDALRTAADVTSLPGQVTTAEGPTADPHPVAPSDGSGQR